jgi:hypothetical protein
VGLLLYRLLSESVTVAHALRSPGRMKIMRGSLQLSAFIRVNPCTNFQSSTPCPAVATGDEKGTGGKSPCHPFTLSPYHFSGQFSQNLKYTPQSTPSFAPIKGKTYNGYTDCTRPLSHGYLTPSLHPSFVLLSVDRNVAKLAMDQLWTTRLRDHTTARLHDCTTARLRDYGL